MTNFSADDYLLDAKKLRDEEATSSKAYTLDNKNIEDISDPNYDLMNDFKASQAMKEPQIDNSNGDTSPLGKEFSETLPAPSLTGQIDNTPDLTLPDKPMGSPIYKTPTEPL